MRRQIVEQAPGRAEACEVLSRASFELLVNADTAALLQHQIIEIFWATKSNPFKPLLAQQTNI